MRVLGDAKRFIKGSILVPGVKRRQKLCAGEINHIIPNLHLCRNILTTIQLSSDFP